MILEMRNWNLLQADAEALVNPVNIVGVMGKGLAFQFKLAFPEMFADYRSACAAGKVQPGRMLVYERSGEPGNPKYIINFPTKRDWRDSSRMEDIESGLVALVQEVKSRGIKSIALPPLGCGLGGLQWVDVRSRIVTAFSVITDVTVIISLPPWMGNYAEDGRAEQQERR